MSIIEAYLTINEFARYEGITSRTVKNWIQKGKISTVKGIGKSKYRRNHPEIQIHFTQLSTREAEEQFLKDRDLLPSKERKPVTGKFSDLKPWQREVADKRQTIVKEYLYTIRDAPRSKLIVLKRHFAKLHSISYKTLDRWGKDYRSGSYYALVPNWNPGRRENKIENDREAVKFIAKTYMVPFGPSKKETYEQYCKEFGHKREHLFTYRGMVGYINRRFTKSEQLLVRDKEIWDRENSPFIRRDWSKLRVNEVWVADGKQIDVCCKFRGKVIFPWIQVVEDLKSRKFVGWTFTPHLDSRSVAQALFNAISKHGRPELFYRDRGREYENYFIQGGKLKQGKALKFSDFDQEDIPKGVLGEMGIKDWNAYQHNPREKPIESGFKVFTFRLRHLPGYRGHSVKTRPRKLESEIKSGKILSFEELEKEVEKVIHERNSRPHSITGRVPNSYYDNFQPIIPSKEILAFLLMDQDFPVVRDSTVTIKGMLYRNDELWRLAGQRVETRRNPKDIRRAAIIHKDKLFGFANLEIADRYDSPVTLESMKTTTRIRRKIAKYRKAIVENEGAEVDPVRFAIEMEEKEKLRDRDIRPADSKVRNIHRRERLARNVIKGLENPEVGEVKKEAAVAGKLTLSRLLAASKPQEVKKPPIRLLHHLSIFDRRDYDDEDDDD